MGGLKGRRAADRRCSPTARGIKRANGMKLRQGRQPQESADGNGFADLLPLEPGSDPHGRLIDEGLQIQGRQLGGAALHQLPAPQRPESGAAGEPAG